MWCFVKKKKNLHESCRMGRHIVVLKLICSLGHCECDGHTVHKLSERRLAADWLAPRESNSYGCTVRSLLWLPRYITATLPVLEISKWLDNFPTALIIYIAHAPPHGLAWLFGSRTALLILRITITASVHGTARSHFSRVNTSVTVELRIEVFSVMSM